MKSVRRLALWVSVAVVVAFVVFVVNQTAQLVALAGGPGSALGAAVLWGLVALYIVLLAVPLVMFLRMPPPIVPPETDSGPEWERHVAALAERLERNPLVPPGADLATREGLEAAVAVLDAEAEAAIREAAGQIFLSTAISQSGRLDTLVVLTTNVRLVWRVARVYYQRPTLRDMWHLYANVAGTAFLAGELDDVDVSEQVQPIVTSVLGSVGTAIPGLQVATSLVVNSVLTGSTNAFLTLRVGSIAQAYAAPLVVADRRRIRRAATTRAAALLGGIVGSGAKRVVKAVVKASRDRLFRRGGPDEDPELEAALADAEETGTLRRWYQRSE